MKIGIIIAFKNFKDEEYFQTRRVLEEAGYKIETISTKHDLADGFDGGQVLIDKTIDEIFIEEYAGLIFIGGPGALKYLDNEKIHELIREIWQKSNLIIGAICITPVILAHANCFSGVKMTVWSDALQRWPIKSIEEKGIIFVDDPVVTDGRLITANGPSSASSFALNIIAMLDKFKG